MTKQRRAAEVVDITHKLPPAVNIERILDTAVQQFAKQGFDGLSMRDLSREAECPAPSIYYHFKSKSELYTQAYEHKFDQTIDFINSRLAAHTDKSRRLEALVEAFFELFTGDRSLLLLMQRDVIDAAASSTSRFLIKQQYEHFSSLILRVASEVKGAPISRETAFTMGALIFGYCELLTVVHGGDELQTLSVHEAEKARLVRAVVTLLSLD